MATDSFFRIVAVPILLACAAFAQGEAAKPPATPPKPAAVAAVPTVPLEMQIEFWRTASDQNAAQLQLNAKVQEMTKSLPESQTLQKATGDHTQVANQIGQVCGASHLADIDQATHKIVCVIPKTNPQPK